MNTENSYPVFEPDQVLTNNHLNNLFNYLDQQSRLSRMKLIGSGIVCGLEINFQENDSISVSKGCGLTSQGFLITFCDTKFTHLINYNTRNFPNDLVFIKQCEDDKSNPKPFYKDEFNDGIFQLITITQFEDLNEDEKQNAITLANNATVDLKKYVVVLFLETEEEDLKNCDTNDCNDKGSRIDFEVKALLVEKTIIDKIKQVQEIVAPVGHPSVNPDLHHVELRRYNVPVQDLKSADEVLQAFANLVDDAKLKSIAEVLNYCFVHYYYLFENETSNPFENVWERFKKLRDDILKDKPILIQYFYDFIDDVLKAYYEFKHKVFEVSSSCCGNEMKFPLHLMLGEAAVSTSSQVRSNYREYFIYSPLFNNQREKLAEVRLLFTRIKLLTKLVDFNSITDFENRFVKITPSRYGYVYLSERCIPFHYNVADKGNELYRYWNYEKTRRGNERFNLGYNAFKYCAADNVIHPLLYDIERFDFYRIEGHIGKNITRAVSIVKSIQQENNLPFDIAALSADYIGALVRGEEPQCMIQDLESDYRVLIAAFICRLHNAFCNVAHLKYFDRQSFLFIKPKLTTFTTSILTREASAESGDDENEKETFDKSDLLQFNIDHPFIATMIEEFHALKNYQKGDTLKSLCNPLKDTIGGYYLANVPNSFSNPVAFNTESDHLKLYHQLFEFIDRFETLLATLMNNELSEVNVDEVKFQYEKINAIINSIHRFINELSGSFFGIFSNSKLNFFENMLLNLFVKNIQLLNQSCFIEQLVALKNEYNRRMAQYRLAKNFSYYFKTHGGIEHKAGVPRGGTFILVYHEERSNRFIDKRSLFINKSLSSLMLSHFRDIIKPEVPLDTLTYKTKLLQTAILYKDPDLYIRFKDVLTKYIDDCHDLPDDKRKEITDIINQVPKRPHFELTDGMVIADFYIPYMCCSDCPPVAYILPPPPIVETEDPTINIDKKSFCSDEKTSFPIIITPKGGVVTGSGVSVQNDGSYVFVPAAAGAGLHTLTYTANGKTATVQVEVIAMPIPKFSFTINVDGVLMFVSFTNESTGTNDQTTYQWLIDGVEFSTLKDPAPINFKVGSLPHTILLKESNGQCGNEFSKDIKLEIEDRSFTLCRKVKEFKLEPNLTATDVVQVLSNDGIKMKDEKLQLLPSSTDISQTTDFHVSYLINGKQVNVTITLIFVSADFIMNLTHNESPIAVFPILLTLKAKQDDADKYLWKVTKVTGEVLDFSDPKVQLNYTQLQIGAGSQLLISLTVTKADQSGNACEETKGFVITESIFGKHLNKGEFDNLTTS